MRRGGPDFRERLHKRLGIPPEGMAWCTGYKRTPHLVKKEELAEKTCRCKTCRAAYRREMYSSTVVRAKARKPTEPSSRGEPDVRQIEPGRVPPSNGEGEGIVLPRWGYATVENGRRSGRNRAGWYGLAA